MNIISNYIGCKEKDEQSEQDVVFLAFARVFSGTMYKGQRVFVLQPRYDPRAVKGVLRTLPTIETADQSILPEYTSLATLTNLYILMGRSVEEVDCACAGNVVGIAGLDGTVLKSATLSSTLACPSFRQMRFAAVPIVEVAVDPYYPQDMHKLGVGMKLLNQADPCVKVTLSETGEHILSAAGEVHLQRCLDDLINVYAKIQLSVSPPMIPFRETIIIPPKVDVLNETISEGNEVKRLKERGLGGVELVNQSGLLSIFTANRMCYLAVKAIPLPPSVIKILETHRELLKSVCLNFSLASADLQAIISKETIVELKKVEEDLSKAFDAAGPNWLGAVNKIWALGPKLSGPNILLNEIEDYHRPSIWQQLEGSIEELREFDASIVHGFQLATLSGPLCEEPMYGVCIAVKKWVIQSSPLPSDISSQDVLQPTSGSETIQQSSAFASIGGQLISTIKEGCRKSFMAQCVRLMLAMYKCKIHATSEVLGRVYAVLHKRQGRVLSEGLKEGSNIFEIDALVPVAESFGFAEEIRKKTSGLASPQLMFSHWEPIEMDPFWVPSTEEELTHFGDKADSENIAQRYMNMIRRRKGLLVEEKLITHGEKQRTLKKS